MRPCGCAWTLRGHIQEPTGMNQQLISKLEGEAEAESREVHLLERGTTPSSVAGVHGGHTPAVSTAPALVV